MIMRTAEKLRLENNHEAGVTFLKIGTSLGSFKISLREEKRMPIIHFFACVLLSVTRGLLIIFCHSAKGVLIFIMSFVVKYSFRVPEST